jgi:hypothetical protein
MIGDHVFWWLLVMACVVWYSTITVYVAIKGGYDIRRMLRRLSEEAAEPRQDAKEDRIA